MKRMHRSVKECHYVVVVVVVAVVVDAGFRVVAVYLIVVLLVKMVIERDFVSFPDNAEERRKNVTAQK